MMLPWKFLAFMVVIAGLSGFGYYMVKDRKSEFKKPHIVLIVADDMGWNDVSFHGANQIPTPNIDALAYNGVILNKHYVLPTCTPSRSSLLTGRYAVREGMQGWPLKVGELRGLPLNSTVMPEYFRKLGYATHLVGKWHLGYATKNYTPTSRGYDSFFGYYSGLITYFSYSVKQSIQNTTVPMAYDLHRDSPGNLTVARGSKYFTDLITDEAEKIIKTNGNEKPLFLKIAHLAVHASEANEPLEVRNFTEVNSTFHYIKDSKRQKYAGMMKAMDESVGRVVTALGEANMLENSIIVFISDNGAPTVNSIYENRGSNYPLRGMKHTLFEGGVRGAACIFSPLIKAASRVSYDMMHIVDWLPTLYAAAGGNSSDLRGEIDGINQWPSISRAKQSPRNSLLVNIADGEEAAIIGKHKLIKGFKDKNSGYLGDIGNHPSYPAYQLNQVLNSPAGLAIHRLPYFNSVSKKRAQKLREHSIVKCGQAAPLTCTGVCLFDLQNDPCEARDLTTQLPDVVRELEKMIEHYRQYALSDASAEVDPCSDAKYFNGTSMPWRTNDTLPRNVSLETQCQHPIYNFTVTL